MYNHMRISEAIDSLLEDYTPKEIADTLGVSTALVSTWKNKDNDFVPRPVLAAKILVHYDIVIWPYASDALEEIADYEAL